jgi:dipeptidyl aminopeptidase/acylaminoacyl peptidase
MGSEEVLLTTEGVLVLPADMSPDGRTVAYGTMSHVLQDPDILALPLVGDRKASALVQTDKPEGMLQFSPDGRWMAYLSFEEDRSEVFVQAYPPTGGRYQVSVAGGISPRWRPDGKEILYLAPDSTLMAVDVSTSPSGFRAGQPRALFKAAINTLGNPIGLFHYAVAADGQRFLVASLLGGEAPPPVTVVLNWAAGRNSEPAR